MPGDKFILRQSPSPNITEHTTKPAAGGGGLHVTRCGSSLLARAVCVLPLVVIFKVGGDEECI